MPRRGATCPSSEICMSSNGFRAADEASAVIVDTVVVALLKFRANLLRGEAANAVLVAIKTDAGLPVLVLSRVRCVRVAMATAGKKLVRALHAARPIRVGPIFAGESGGSNAAREGHRSEADCYLPVPHRRPLAGSRFSTDPYRYTPINAYMSISSIYA